VLDISSPYSPVVIAEVPISGFPLSVSANGTRVAVSSDREGVPVFQRDLGMPPRMTETLADTGEWVSLLDGFASVHRLGTWTICPHGHSFRLRDAFRACLRHGFSAALETKYGTLGRPRATVDVLDIAPGFESGVVTLLGDDRAALDKLWATIVADGGRALRQRDARSYADLER
jgi:hypothetical protein